MTQDLRYPVALAGCLEACRRCGVVLRGTPPELFGATGDGVAAIGSHLRHCLDHFACFFDGLETDEIDYDARPRDPEVETDPERCGAVLEAVTQRLEALPPDRLGAAIRVRQMGAPGRNGAAVPSTVERELLFLSGHTIHHLALISHMADVFGLDYGQDIATAFSTAAFQASG